MFGCILLGAAGLFMAGRMFQRHHNGCHGGGRWGRYPGGFGRADHGPWGGGGPGEGGVEFAEASLHRGFGRRFFVQALADKLDASPAQQKVLRDATDELREAAFKLKGEARQTRADVAGAFRKSHFDAVLFGELFARHDGALEELRKAFVGAGARVHDALDEGQRARLAELIEAGPGRWGRGWGRGARGAWSW